jgi:hypothetical protein
MGVIEISILLYRQVCKYPEEEQRAEVSHLPFSFLINWD